MSEYDLPDDDTPGLDADQVACPRCNAGPGAVCRTPSGTKAKTVHRERRDLANGFHTARLAPEQPPAQNPGTAEGRSKGGKAAAAARRERRDEIARLVGNERARAIQDRAADLAEDAVRWDTDRMTLKRMVLDVGMQAWATLGTALQGYRRVELDESDRQMTVPREVTVTDEEGRTERKVVEVPDVRGAYGPDDVKALATAAGIALDKVRLEEGSATSRSEHVTGALGQGLGDLEDAELRRFADTARKAIDELDEGTDA